MVHLFQEGLAAGEGFRVQNLQEDIAAPALLSVLAAEAGQALGQRLDHQREAEALVAVLKPAQQQQAASRLGLLQEARIGGRPSLGIEQPGMLELLAGGSLLTCHGDGRDRGADVDQDGRRGPGIANGERVGRKQRLAPAVRGDEAEGGIGGGQDGDTAAVCRLLHERREAGDVMAAAHGEGDHPVRCDALECDVKRLVTSHNPGR